MTYTRITSKEIGVISPPVMLSPILTIFAASSPNGAKVAVVAALVILLACLFVFAPSASRQSEFHDTLIAVILPLLFTFVFIVIFETM